MSHETMNEAPAPLVESVRMLGFDLPKRLRVLLTEERELSGKPNVPDKDVRAFIYRAMYTFLSDENGIGDGCSLIYPEEVVDTVRTIYPGDIKDYAPRSRKRTNFYEVPLRELIEVYREGDIKDDLKRRTRVTQDNTTEDVHQDNAPGPSKKHKHV